MKQKKKRKEIRKGDNNILDIITVTTNHQNLNSLEFQTS